MDLNALHHAIKRGDIIAVREYVANGGPVAFRAPEGWTPLAMAAARGHTPIVALFLDAGADVNEGWPGHTPLLLAAMSGSLPAAELLLARGAKTDACGLPLPELLPQLGYGRHTTIIEAIARARSSAV